MKTKRIEESSLLKKRILYSVASVIVAGALFILLIVANLYENGWKTQSQLEIESEAKSQKSTIIEYGENGLLKGVELEASTSLITKDYIYFNDRIVRTFKNDAVANQYTSDAINGLMNSLPTNVSKYVLLIPAKIEYESKLSEYTDSSVVSINEIYSQLSNDIIKLDADATLRKQSQEYLYLRTDNDLTSLGAYYLSKTFCESKNIKPIDISSYNKYTFSGFYGSFSLLQDANVKEDAFDHVDYYMNPSIKNRQTLTARKQEGVYETYQTQTILLSRRGMDIFVAGEFSHSIIEGNLENKEVLLIIGDSSAKMLATWLTPYYETIYIVSTKRYQNGSQGFKNIFSEFHVTDVLLTEEAENFGYSLYNRKINGLTR